MPIVPMGAKEDETEDYASSQPHLCQHLKVGRMNLRSEKPTELFHLLLGLEFSHSPLEIIPPDTGQRIRQEFPGRNLPELQPQISRPLVRIRDRTHLFPVGGPGYNQKKPSDRNSRENHQSLIGRFHQRVTQREQQSDEPPA